MAKMFQDEVSEESNLLDVDSEEDLQAAWRAWISAEERKRYFSLWIKRRRLAEDYTG